MCFDLQENHESPYPKKIILSFFTPNIFKDALASFILILGEAFQSPLVAKATKTSPLFKVNVFIKLADKFISSSGCGANISVLGNCS